MLILTRYAGQEILIGDDIKISVLGQSGRQVRIGIEAPDDVPIVRTEIMHKYAQGERIRPVICACKIGEETGQEGEK